MTPKEKAIELVDEFYTTGYTVNYFYATLCALTTVKHLIKETGSKYWYDVEKEINLL